MCREGQDMCQVDSFCCGCADLRKGALIIGSVNLVFALMMMSILMRVMGKMVIVVPAMTTYQEKEAVKVM